MPVYREQKIWERLSFQKQWRVTESLGAGHGIAYLKLCFSKMGSAMMSEMTKKVGGDQMTNLEAIMTFQIKYSKVPTKVMNIKVGEWV